MLKNKYCCKSNKEQNINQDQDLAILAKALGHPARVRIVKELLKRKTCVCGQIVEHVKDLAQSTVSQHLKVLKEAGLIIGETEGTSVCYCIDKNKLKYLKSLLNEI